MAHEYMLSKNAILLKGSFRELRLLQLLIRTFKAAPKLQNSTENQANLDILIKLHVASKVYRNSSWLLSWQLCHGRHGSKEVYWSAVPWLPIDQRSTMTRAEAHLSLWVSPRSTRGPKIVLPTHWGNKLSISYSKEGIITKWGKRCQVLEGCGGE